MALPASAFSLSSFRMKSLKSQGSQLHKRLLIHGPSHPIAASCSVKLPTMAQFREPPKLKLHMNYIRERMWDIIPDSVKEFPWKRAEDIALKQLLVYGKVALKWSLITLFVFSSMSDVIYSIYRNKELLLSFGLFVGCMITNLLKETSQELFPNSEKRGLRWHLTWIGCFFVLVKILSAYFTIGGRVFLSNAANGGFMQILWLWKSLPQGQEVENREDFLHEGTSAGLIAED